MIRTMAAMALIATAVAQDGAGPCAPEDRGGSVAGTSGTIRSDEIVMDWVVASSWSTGHCVDMRFTNTGSEATAWSFEVTFSGAIRDVSFTGEQSGLLTLSGSTGTVAPLGDATLPALATVEASACFEPKVTPSALEATVERDGDDGGDDGPLFGTLRPASGEVVVTWDQRGASIDDDCVELSIGNLTDAPLTSWRLRLLFPAPVSLTGADNAFFVLDDTAGELDVRPTSKTLEIDAFDTAEGEICFDPLTEPYAVVFTHADSTP